MANFITEQQSECINLIKNMARKNQLCSLTSGKKWHHRTDYRMLFYTDIADMVLDSFGSTIDEVDVRVDYYNHYGNRVIYLIYAEFIGVDKFLVMQESITEYLK